MRKRWKVDKGKSKKLFTRTAYPVKANRRSPGLKRGGHRL